MNNEELIKEIRLALVPSHLSTRYHPWMEEATRYMDDNKIVSAVKTIRASTGWSLRQSKITCDFYRDHGSWDVEAVMQRLIDDTQQRVTDQLKRTIELEDLIDEQRRELKELNYKLQRSVSHNKLLTEDIEYYQSRTYEPEDDS